MNQDLCVGVDIVPVARFKRLLNRFGGSYASLIFTAQEWEIYGRFPLRLAARFAAKEAVGKALHVGLDHMHPAGVPATDIEVLNYGSGEPCVHLFRRASERAEALRICEFQITLSHSAEIATALVVGIIASL